MCLSTKPVVGILVLAKLIAWCRHHKKTGMAQRQARGAHNSEVTGSKPVVGILVLAKLIAWYRHHKKTGMAQRQARGAHNSEVTGSKPVAGILVLAKLIAWCRHNHWYSYKLRGRDGLSVQGREIETHYEYPNS